jgi:hypothetical protein
MSGMSCPCEGSTGVSLAICLAPPPGDYEVVMPLGRGRELVLNSTGIYIRSLSMDDFLPFMRTQSMRISEETITRLGINIDRLLCESVRGLLEAAKHGSLKASEILKRCQNLLNSLLATCGAEPES